LCSGATNRGRLPWTISFVSDVLVLVSNQYLADAEAVQGGGAKTQNDSSLSFSLPVNVCPEPVLANRRRFPSKKRSSEFLGSDKQTGEGADPKRVAAVPADPGNVTVFRRDPADGSLTPTGAQWTAPHVMSAQAAV
jgi:hypothetical protein